MSIPAITTVASSFHRSFVFSWPSLAVAVFARRFFSSSQNIFWGIFCGFFIGKLVHNLAKDFKYEIISSKEPLLYKWMQKSTTTLFFLKCLSLISLPFSPKTSFYTAFALSLIFSFTAEYREGRKDLMGLII